MKLSRYIIPVALVTLSVILWASVEPALHAARVGPRELSLPEQIYKSATEQEAALKAVSFEERQPSSYPRVVDLYRQVAESVADDSLVDRARMRMADLTREMALRTGDASQYAEAIDIYRRLVLTRPDSPYVGEALVAIAQIYEYELQDVDGATAAFREIVRRFPASIAAREAGANVMRLDPTFFGGDTGTDIIGAIVAPGAEVALAPGNATGVQVINLRSFAGPDYARVVVDLNRSAEYAEKRVGTRIVFSLPGAELSPALIGRRLSTPRGSILKAMRVEQLGDGISITLDLATLESASTYSMGDPARLVIDLRGAGGARPDTLIPRRSPADLIAGRPLDEEFAVPLPAPAPLPGAGAVAPPPAPPEVAAPSKPPEAIGARPAAGSAPVRCIVIDAGHGGSDTGTIGPGGLAEKDVCLDIARRLRASLRAELPGVEIILTRDSDRYLSLEERTAIANARNADLFISIHANASQSKSASGIETYVADAEALRAHREQQAKNGNQLYASVSFASQVSESRSLAGFVQGSLVRGVSAKSPSSAKDRGIKHASFAVLRGAHMPSILAEVSFVSNPDDENRLRTPAFRQRIASALTGGIRGYVRAQERKAS